MYVQTTFHGVGQGLFHSGRIGSFDYVYDCGSRPAGQIKQELTGYIKSMQGKHLDLLIVSHLDEDHVSGLKDLVTAKKPQTVILPYLPPSERLVLILQNVNFGGWYYLFLADPITFFRSNGVNDLVFIGRGNPEESDPDADGPGQGRFPGMDNSNTNLRANVDGMTDDGELKDLIADYEISLSGIRTKSHHSNLPIQWSGGDAWYFRFFNYKGKKFVKKDFFNCGKPFLGTSNPKKITTSMLVSLLQKKKDIDGLKICYKKYSNYINNTSLLAFHGPLLHATSVSQTSGFEVKRLRTANYLGIGQIGYLLTGDLDFSSNAIWTDFSSHFGGYLSLMSDASIPHHGARKNWTNKLLDKSFPGANWYVSSAIGSQHDHPSMKTLGKIFNSGRRVFWCNERFSAVNHHYVF